MSAPDVAVPSLVNWGVTPDADLIYRRLVMFGRAPATTLARELALPSRRLSQALDELASLGGARRARGQTAYVWVARPSAEVVVALRNNRRRPHPVDADRHLRARPSPVDEVLERAAELGDGIRHLRTRPMTRERLAELVAVASHEHLAMNPEPAFAAESARPAVAMDRTLLKRGVSMRVLGVQSTEPDPMSQHGRGPADLTPTYRQLPAVPMKLIVVDRQVALFPVTPSDLEHGYLEIGQKPIVDALVATFERHWTTSHVTPEPPMPQITLNAREQALIELLAQGHTDVSAARELRISARSVTAILRTLMDRLCVTNRFQLGLALGTQHVVTPPPQPRKDGHA